MQNQLEIATRRLSTENGLHARDFKLFPGSSRDATAEQVAEQINKAISQIESGDFEVVEDEEID